MNWPSGSVPMNTSLVQGRSFASLMRRWSMCNQTAFSSRRLSSLSLGFAGRSSGKAKHGMRAWPVRARIPFARVRNGEGQASQPQAAWMPLRRAPIPKRLEPWRSHPAAARSRFPGVRLSQRTRWIPSCRRQTGSRIARRTGGIFSRGGRCAFERGDRRGANPVDRRSSRGRPLAL